MKMNAKLNISHFSKKVIVCFVMSMGACAFFLFAKMYKNNDLMSNPSETILFSISGNRPFQDYIYTIKPDGTEIKKFLTPSNKRSYLYASSCLGLDLLLVWAHEYVPDKKKIEDHLYLYDAKKSQWRPIVENGGEEGPGVASTDGKQVVFTRKSESVVKTYNVWVADLRTFEKRQLTDVTKEYAWDAEPIWNPNNKEVAFLRYQVTDKGLTGKLMTIPVIGKNEPHSIIEDNTINACYSPDGKRMLIWTVEDPIFINLANPTQRETVHLPIHRPDYIYRVRPIIWSNNKIAFNLYNQKMDRDELWIMDDNGHSPRLIYTHKNGNIHLGSFISH